MGDYREGKKSTQIETSTTTKVINNEINMDALADMLSDAVSKAVSQIPISKRSNLSFDMDDEKNEFDDSRTLERIANAMIIERERKDSNFKNLGEVKTTNKTQEEVDATIDLLQNLDD